MRSGRRTQRRSTLWLLLVALGTAFVFAVPPAGAATTSPDPAPVVSSVSPSTGYFSSEQAPEASTSVTISGTNLDGATIVWFGKFSAPFKVVSSSEIVATAVGTNAGTVDVTVTTPAGTSATSAADQFTFTTPPVPTVPPAVASVTPSTVSAAGGTEVTVNGSNFSYATSAHVGSTGIAVSPLSPTEVLVDVPPEPLGSVLDLTVTGPAGTSATSPADRITYVAPPPPPPTAGYWDAPIVGVAGTPQPTMLSTPPG
jgi:hypothetical protein